MSDLISKAAAIQAVFDWEQGKISGTIADAIAAIPATDARADALRGALAKAANRLDWAAGIIESNKARDQVGQWADEARAILRALEEEGR